MLLNFQDVTFTRRIKKQKIKIYQPRTRGLSKRSNIIKYPPYAAIHRAAIRVYIFNVISQPHWNLEQLTTPVYCY